MEAGAASIDLVLKEACNAILMSLRRGLIDEGRFRNAVKAVMLLAGANIKMLPQRELIEDAVNIAHREGVTVYDSLYLALAKRMEAPLLSVDARQVHAARSLGLRSIRV